MARSLNKVQLIGNLTRDPELRYTPAGTAVCTFGLATNRQWTTESGEKKEDAEFHRIVAWQKLAELCAQLLAKGRKVYVEGRLQTRRWSGQDGQERTTTEIVINDMIILDSRGAAVAPTEDFNVPEDLAADEAPSTTQGVERKETPAKSAMPSAPTVKKSKKPEKAGTDDEAKEADKDAKEESEDIPF